MFLQANNVVVKTEGHLREEPELYNHVDLVQLLDIVDLESGTMVAGVIQLHSFASFCCRHCQALMLPWRASDSGTAV